MFYKLPVQFIWWLPIFSIWVCLNSIFTNRVASSNVASCVRELKQMTEASWVHIRCSMRWLTDFSSNVWLLFEPQLHAVLYYVAEEVMSVATVNVECNTDKVSVWRSLCMKMFVLVCFQLDFLYSLFFLQKTSLHRMHAMVYLI